MKKLPSFNYEDRPLTPEEVDDIIFHVLRPAPDKEMDASTLMTAVDVFLGVTSHPPTKEERELIERDEHVSAARAILAKAEWLCK
jgi:hypothetical protein